MQNKENFPNWGLKSEKNVFRIDVGSSSSMESLMGGFGSF